VSSRTYTGIDAHSFPCQEQLLSQRSVTRAYPGGAAEKNVVENMPTGAGFPLQTVRWTAERLWPVV